MHIIPIHIIDMDIARSLLLLRIIVCFKNRCKFNPNF